MMIPQYQIEILKRAMNEAKETDESLYNALGHAILKLENHVCPNFEPQKESKYEPDYWDKLNGESQNEKFGR